MSAEIISSHRYKKTTRKEVANKKKNNKIKYSTKTKKANDLKYKKNKLNSIKQSNKIKKSTYSSLNSENIRLKYGKKKIYIPTIFKVGIVIIAIVSIGFLSRKIVSLENMPILSVFSNKDSNVNLQKDYALKLGISKLDTTDTLTSKNIILNELFLNSSFRLIQINNDYTINYLVASKIEKISNKEYLIYFNKEYDIDYSDLNDAINKIKSAGESNIYYKNVSNIKEIASENGYIRILLNKEDPYYIYKLDFPLNIESKKLDYTLENVYDTSISFKRLKSDSTIESITLTNYLDTDNMVADFRDDKIDIFFASSDSIMQLIGKHEYNVKKYRDGQNIFLLGNKDSQTFKIKEIRKALAYSLKREDIIKEINNTFSELIDLPFIYSDIKYKYDIYGAENELLSNGWKKVDGIYTKNVDGVDIKAELNILVNEEDATKLKIANMIKEMAQNVGIKININTVKSVDFQAKVQNKEYDIILADVYTNQYPDIEYLKDYLNINEEINNAFNNVYTSNNVEELQQNIKSLQEKLSSEVACIGILARNTNVVYQKYITGFDYTNYFKVFSNFNNVGRISKD